MKEVKIIGNQMLELACAVWIIKQVLIFLDLVISGFIGTLVKIFT